MASQNTNNLLQELQHLNAPQLRRLLVEHLTKQKLGLYWESNAIARDAALNANVVLPRLVPEFSHTPEGTTYHRNLIIEGDNFDSLRLLRATHAGKVRVIYIDPPYNTGNKDWVYNDKFVGANDRWRHSQWLEFLYQRLTLARELLTSDGVILVSINDENRSRLELLMDEVFPGRRVGSLIWKKRRSSNAAGVEHFFSCDHEHVLIYGVETFEFSGSAKNWDKYDQWDEKAQDWWTSTQLTLGFNRQQRPNLFYPLHNPQNDIWYPCDANRVWARASAKILKGKEVRTETMEVLIERNGVSFPDDKMPAVYASIEEIKAAIQAGTAPRHLESQDDLSFWIGKRIGFGKPRFKTYKTKVRNESQPLSSLIAEAGKTEVDSDGSYSITSGLTSEGTRVLRDLSLGENFPYPKPLSLIKGLLSQTTRPNDIVLDFFAGSGTTGQAVLELNGEDGGQRRFILCSNTEATTKEPEKNLCRDVCAERLRRVMAGYGGKPGYTVAQGGEFAYLQLDKIEAADVAFEATPDHAAALLYMKEMATAPVSIVQAAIQIIAKGGDWLTVLCAQVTPETLDALAALPAAHGVARLAVFCPRPKALAALLADRGVEANTYSITDALLKGQASGKAAAMSAATGAEGAAA